MPVYLFTYHAYGTWLPDRSRGFVKRGQGILPPDLHMYRLCVKAMNETTVDLDDTLQRLAIAAILESEPLQRFEVYYVATDSTHVHVLLAWRDERDPVKMRSLLKGSLSRSFNRVLGRRAWLTEGGSRKKATSRNHLAYLLDKYLPRHAGWKWSREQGLHK